MTGNIKVYEGEEIYDPLEDSSDSQFENMKVGKEGYILQPGEFILAESFEKLGISKEYFIKLNDSSSLARCGISNLGTGVMEPGCGQDDPVRITLELCNTSSKPIKLKPTLVENDTVHWGTEIFRCCFGKLEHKPEQGYPEWKNSAYSSDKEVRGSKMAGRFPKKSNL